jgi:hypothetical protein
MPEVLKKGIKNLVMGLKSDHRTSLAVETIEAQSMITESPHKSCFLEY